MRALAGRTVVSGFPGRLNDLGVDWYTRDQDLRNLYAKPSEADVVIRQYDIDYIVVGPYEKSMFIPESERSQGIHDSYLSHFGALVFSTGNYWIYETQGENG